MGTSPFYVNDHLVSSRNTYKTRLHIDFELLLRKINLGQKSISITGPSILNKLNNDLKILNATTSFIHNHKKLVLKT